MSTEPVILMVARRVRDGRYHDLLAWLHEGEQLAADFTGHLGSGVLAPPPGDDEFQIVLRFADEQTLDAWEHSASRRTWLQRGGELFGQPHEHRARGIDTWFGETATHPLRAGNRAWRSGWHSFPCRCCSTWCWAVCSANTASGDAPPAHHLGADAVDDLSVHSAFHAPAGALVTDPASPAHTSR